MIKQIIRYDLNAHISGIKAIVLRDSLKDSDVQVIISFTNLGYGTIKAIRLRGRAFDAFGKPVTIGGKSTVDFVREGLNIHENKKTTNLVFKLSSAKIYNLEVEESQIRYADGRLVAYEGPKYVELPVTRYDISDPTEAEQVLALKNVFGVHYQYVPQKTHDGWICGCGSLNKEENNMCTFCKCAKDRILDSINPDVLAEILTHYREVQFYREQFSLISRVQELQREKRKKRVLVTSLSALAGCAALVIVLILIFLK